jgi:hypothetical protein
VPPPTEPVYRIDKLHRTCSAIFDGRMIHVHVTTETTIDPHNQRFLEAARLMELSAEAVRGQGGYVRS